MVITSNDFTFVVLLKNDKLKEIEEGTDGHYKVNLTKGNVLLRCSRIFYNSNLTKREGESALL